MKSSDLNGICTHEKQQHINEFADYCCDKLGIDRPKLTLKGTNDTNALGYTDMSDGSVTIVVADRHQMDIMRTLAHELVHCKQMTTHTPCGDTGSEDENEANALAGVLMREWGQNNPDLYTEGVDVSKNTDEARFKFKKPPETAQDRLDRRAAAHGIGTPDKEKFYTDIKKKFQSALDNKDPHGHKKAKPMDLSKGGSTKVKTYRTDEGQKCWPGYEKKGTKKMFGKTVNNCVKKESVEQVDEIIQAAIPIAMGLGSTVIGGALAGAGAAVGGIVQGIGSAVRKDDDDITESKTARMMALITALGATYGLEDEARAFADQIKQNIHNAQTAEPNPGRPDPVTPGNMMPGSDRVMRPQLTKEQRLREIKKRQMMIRQKIQEISEAKKDACYNKVRSRYKVWPSAYASGALVQCRKKGAKNWGNKSKK